MSALLGRLSLGTKLLAAPAVGIVALAIVAATAYGGLAWLRSTISTLNEVRFGHLQLAMEANAFTQEAQQQLGHSLSASQADRNAVLAKLSKDELLGKLRSAIPTLEFLIAQEDIDATEREIIASTMESLKDYVEMVDSAFTEQQVDPMTARKLESAFGVLSWNLTKLVGVERDLTSQAFAESQQRSRRILLGFSALLAVSLLVALGATVVVTRHVRSKIVAIHTAASELSSGNLACRAEVSSNDEIGQTARAFNFLVDELASTMSQLQSANTRLSDEMLAILQASQTLSSETDLSRLKALVVELLAKMTGATRVHLASRDPDADTWLLAQDDGQGQSLVLEDAVHAKLIPLSAFSHAQLRGAPLVVEDALADERFMHDAYFAAMDFCSLLAIPILHQGTARAVLILENDSKPGVFSSSPLDAVMLIARQLAISLENVRIYEELERRVQQRTGELRAAQAALVEAARRAGMAEIATNVLHNVGNVLNSVNVSTSLIRATVEHSKSAALAKVVEMLDTHSADLPAFLGSHPKGKLVPEYLGQLSKTLAEERKRALEDLGRLTVSVDHIREIVTMQQSYAGHSPKIVESIRVQDLVDDALRMNAEAFTRSGLTVIKEIADVPPMPLDRHRMLLIMVNLISNAKQAMKGTAGAAKEIRLKVDVADGPKLRVRVSDKGEGIAPENLTRIFAHGFTTRRDGHGFGLHSCALAAMEMGGKLTAHSDGAGRGATFTLEIPMVAAGA